MELEGVVRNGVVVPDNATALPEGMRMRLMPMSDADPAGTTGDEQADDPAAVAAWLAAFDAIPPLRMTAAEADAGRAGKR